MSSPVKHSSEIWQQQHKYCQCSKLSPSSASPWNIHQWDLTTATLSELKVVTTISCHPLWNIHQWDLTTATYYPNSKLSHSSAVISCETFISEIWQQQHKYYHSISVQSCHHHQPSHHPLWSIHCHQSDMTTSSNRNTVSTQGCHQHRPSHHPLRSIHFSSVRLDNKQQQKHCQYSRLSPSSAFTPSPVKHSFSSVRLVNKQHQKHCQYSRLSPLSASTSSAEFDSSNRNTVSAQSCNHHQPPLDQWNLTAATETLSVLKVVTVATETLSLSVLKVVTTILLHTIPSETLISETVQ